MEMSKKLNAIIPDETWDALEEIAAAEKRTKSQMAAFLLADGIALWRERNLPKETNADTPETKNPPATKAKRGSS